MQDIKKEQIKARMVKHVADLWGLQQSDLDGFDPVIELLLGACSVEFERVGNYIHSSQRRMLERLASLLLPEGLTVPQPAHTILHAQSVEPTYTLNRQDQFTYSREIVNPARPNELEEKTIYFSPVAPYRLFDASIAYVAIGKQLFKQTGFNLREQICRTKDGESIPENHVWMAIETNPDLEFLPMFRFFFDWKNNPQRSKLLDLLPLARWSMNSDHALDHKTGYEDPLDAHAFSSESQLSKEWDVLTKIEHKIHQRYKPHFISVRNSQVKISDHQTNYPDLFEAYFDQEALKTLKLPVTWIRLEVPRLIGIDDLLEMQCELNCFPALNRQLIDNQRPYRLEDNLNILPLRSEDYFLAMNKVSDDLKNDLAAVPFHNIRSMEGGTYTIRKNSVGRFESRNARMMLDYVLELMRDENAAFAALGGSISSQNIRELDEKINKIEVELKKKSIDMDVTHFLMLNPGKARQIYLSYWSTAGTIANKIPSGTSLDSKSPDILSGSVRSVMSSSGGKDLPTEQEKLHSFRSSLLSRDRLVTKQDVISACYAELGNAIRGVKVEKAYKNLFGENNGISRVLDVRLSLKVDEKESADSEKICADLENILNQRSSSYVPITVSLDMQ